MLMFALIAITLGSPGESPAYISVKRLYRSIERPETLLSRAGEYIVRANWTGGLVVDAEIFILTKRKAENKIFD